MWKFLALLVFATSYFWSLPARAHIYQCRAADGSTHFTNLRGHNPTRCKVVVRSSKRRRVAPPVTEEPKPAASPASDAAMTSAVAFAPLKPLVTAPGTTLLPPATTAFDDHIRGAAELYQLPPALIRAVMHIESSFKTQAVSVDGAMGLMQLMPQTAASMGVHDPFDPHQNIYGGARYLRILANRFQGDMILTLAAYNAGQGAVDRYRGVPPYPETQRYVRNVLQTYHALKSTAVD